MSDDVTKQALAELGDVVRCRCHAAYKDRGMHDPECQCDSADAVAVVAARIEALEREIAEASADAERLAEAVSLTVRTDKLREAYHALPNEHNRIGSKRSKKGHARDAWLRAFRKAAKHSTEALAAHRARKEKQDDR